MKIDEININKKLENLSANAYAGTTPTECYIVSKKGIAKLEGYIYEPSYESFSATNCITLNGDVLFGKNAENVGMYHNEVYTFGKLKSFDEAIKYLQEYFRDEEVSLSYDKNIIEKLQEEEEEEEEF